MALLSPSLWLPVPALWVQVWPLSVWGRRGRGRQGQNQRVAAPRRLLKKYSLEGYHGRMPDSTSNDSGVSALDEQDLDVFVHTRGGGHVSIWFAAPPDVAGECGEYPVSRVREHLKDLGFRRVVVTVVNESRGLCSFSP